MNKSAKIKAAIATAKAKRAAQTVVVDEHWRIVRSDKYSWTIMRDGEFYGYFGSLEGALRALPIKMLDAEAKNDLRHVYGSLDGILERVEQAIKCAKLRCDQ